MKLTDLHFWFYKNYKYVLIRGHLSAFRGIQYAAYSPIRWAEEAMKGFRSDDGTILTK